MTAGWCRRRPSSSISGASPTPRFGAGSGARLTDFPLRCVTEPTTFDPAGLADVRKVYVAHTDPPLDSLAPFYAEATAAGWETHELAYGHDMMLVAPEATATLLERIAAGPAAAGAVPSRT